LLWKKEQGGSESHSTMGKIRELHRGTNVAGSKKDTFALL
jgi:hypothetical protein